MSHQYHAADRITSLVDFYGFQDGNGRNRAQLEADILSGIADSTRGYDARFVLPYVQMHEFEGLLFTKPSAFEWVQDGWSEQVRTALEQVRNSFASPEDINNRRETAPSKRILSIFGEGVYSKTEHGPLIAERIGIDEIRRQCPQFDTWLTSLEAWGS
jgi:hypothetical protein